MGRPPKEVAPRIPVKSASIAEIKEAIRKNEAGEEVKIEPPAPVGTIQIRARYKLVAIELVSGELVAPLSMETKDKLNIKEVICQVL
jgi:hypothetical protein